MTDAEIAKYAKADLEPIEIPAIGRSYRCSARLVDDLYLPCVVIASKKEVVGLALRRFAETKQEGVGFFRRRRFGYGFNYASVVESFVATGNRLNSYDIRSLEPSPFAMPTDRLREIHGETSMGWTQFTATMADGKTFTFGTTSMLSSSRYQRAIAGPT
jgi:hypothetical protein